MGTVSGVFDAYPDACLIWIDAHAVSYSHIWDSDSHNEPL
jgi:hypothetical protein